MRKEIQKRLVVQKRVVDPQRAQLRRVAAELHEVYKRYKAGIIKDADMTQKQRELLKRYYGL
jgi:hypothetical protein